jgi:hypothetical protein
MTVFGAPALAAEMGQDTQSPEVGLTEENLLKVIPDSYLNTADPDAVLSRGAFAAMLVKAAGIPESGMTENQGLPPDLATGEWYSGAVKALYEKNILQGFPDKKIYPEKPITGIEALALVARTLGLPEGVAAPIGELRDIAGDHWGYELYSWLVKEGLTLKDMDIFKPIGPGDAAKLLVKVFGTDREARDIVEEANEKNK